MKQQHNKHRLIGSALSLLFFQVIAMLLPLVSLPILAKALGVAMFGQVMLAQTIVFFAVIFIDAGFNVESQRQISQTSDSVQYLQILLDNLIARMLVVLPVASIALIAGAIMPNVPFHFVAVSLIQVLGTLMFPQWWMIATANGFMMGLMQVIGRLISVLAIWLLVKTPDDGLWAAFALSIAVVISGVLVAHKTLLPLYVARASLDFSAWKSYLARVRPTIFSGFFAQITSTLPTVMLGIFSTTIAVGLFSAADRLTRAVAHMTGLLEQSFMGYLGQTFAQSRESGIMLRRKTLWFLAVALLLAIVFSFVLTPFVILLLYGSAFAQATIILQILCIWLALYIFRRAMVLWTWSLAGQLTRIATVQWLESVLFFICVGVGAWIKQAQGVALAMVCVECILMAWVGLKQWGEKTNANEY